ncbi:MAG: hypothetical protein NVS3B11_11880 [Collimonas sp.]
MNTARTALIAILSIATLAGSIVPAQAAPQQTEVSTLPTITIIGKRPSHPEFMQTVTIVGKRLNREQKSILARQEANHKKAVI